MRSLHKNILKFVALFDLVLFAEGYREGKITGNIFLIFMLYTALIIYLVNNLSEEKPSSTLFFQLENPLHEDKSSSMQNNDYCKP